MLSKESANLVLIYDYGVILSCVLYFSKFLRIQNYFVQFREVVSCIKYDNAITFIKGTHFDVGIVEEFFDGTVKPFVRLS